MATSLGKVTVQLEDDARMVFWATRLYVCQATKCKFWFQGECSLKTIHITENGGCGYFELKKEGENNADR